MSKIKPFIMFEGQAEEALNFYIEIFDDSEIKSLTRYGENEPGVQGTVNQATFSLKGQEFMCIDSHVNHGFTFTPSISFFVTCDSEEEIERVFAALSREGSVLMPLGAYPFSKKFGWVADRFGVPWQLTLEK